MFQNVVFPKQPVCSTVGSQPSMPSPMGSQLFNHWFLAPHVFNQSTICSNPHMCSMTASQPYLTPCAVQHERKQFFFVKWSDTVFDQPNDPSPVAQLVINSLLLVQPLKVHPDTLHELIPPPPPQPKYASYKWP